MSVYKALLPGWLYGELKKPTTKFIDEQKATDYYKEILEKKGFKFTIKQKEDWRFFISDSGGELVALVPQKMEKIASQKKALSKDEDPFLRIVINSFGTISSGLMWVPCFLFFFHGSRAWLWNNLPMFWRLAWLLSIVILIGFLLFINRKYVPKIVVYLSSSFVGFLILYGF